MDKEKELAVYKRFADLVVQYITMPDHVSLKMYMPESDIQFFQTVWGVVERDKFNRDALQEILDKESASGK